MKKSIFNLNRAFGLPIFLFSFLLLVPVYLNIHEYLFDYQSDSLLHHDIGFLNSVFIIPIWIWALGEYSYHRKDNRFLLLLIEPIFILLAYFTNDYHQLLFDGVNTVDHVEMTRKVRGFGPLRLIHAIYTAILWNVSSFWFCYKIYQKSSLKWFVPMSLLLSLLLIQGLFWLNIFGYTYLRLGGPIFLILLIWSVYFARIFEYEDLTSDKNAFSKFQSVNEKKLSKTDLAFKERVLMLLEENLSNENFNALALSVSLGYSKSQLNRKLQTIFKTSPAALIKKYRLQSAHQFLEEGEKNISEVAFLTGFNSQAYFSTSFKKHFGYTPGSLSKGGEN